MSHRPSTPPLSSSMHVRPSVPAGILGIYGLIVAAILVGKIAAPVTPGQNAYSGFAGFAHLAAGLACGLSSLSAGGSSAPLRIPERDSPTHAFCLPSPLPSRLGDWSSRRCWCTSCWAAASALRRHDSYPHFRRSAGSVWSHCRPHSVAEGHGCQVQCYGRLGLILSHPTRLSLSHISLLELLEAHSSAPL